MGLPDNPDAHAEFGTHTKKLIEAVVGAAYGQDEPPPELLLAWRCQQWTCLPEAGGYMEQDYITAYRMTAYLNIYNVLRHWQSLQGKDIHRLADGERKLLRWLKDEGIMFQ